MLSFVKSLFVSSPPRSTEDESKDLTVPKASRTDYKKEDNDSPSSESSSEGSRSRVGSASVSSDESDAENRIVHAAEFDSRKPVPSKAIKRSGNRGSSNSSSQSYDLSQGSSAVSKDGQSDSHKNSRATRGPGPDSKDEGSSVASSPRAGDETYDDGTLSGALYLVDGHDFECLAPQATVDVDGRMLIISPVIVSSPSKSPEVKQPQQPISYHFRVDRISHFRQHLPDAVQFMVRDAKDGGLEYGFQFDSEMQAFKFRIAIFEALLSVTSLMASVPCAIAEYDTEAKEFVILSKTAAGKICKRLNDGEGYLVIEDEKDDSAGTRVVFVDTLTREIQLWPSPQTNQVTFWGVAHQRRELAKRMFIMEMDPERVSKAAVNLWFRELGAALEDLSFARIDEGEKADGEPEIDEFDVGPVGDGDYKKTWRTPSRGRRRSLSRGVDDYDADRARGDDYEEEDGDEDSSSRLVVERYKADSDARASVPVHRFMEVGSERTFVCRGDPGDPGRFKSSSRGGPEDVQIKVYQRNDDADDDDGGLETVGSISGSKFKYKNQAFAPSRGLLHDRERKLLVVPEGKQAGEVYMMDIEMEKIVQRWDADDTAIQTMFPTFKKGQNSIDPTFLCTNPRNLFMMDTRIANTAKSTAISYLTNPQLTVGATDESGHILVGSKLGELRLYDGQANQEGKYKRAKTLLQTVKDPILAVDVLNDGSWILATTKTFLVVFPTKPAGSHKTGFETALGQHKPAPRYLTLLPDDIIKYKVTDIDFAPAKFDAEEDSIVTSTGNMAVVWDFASVKRGKPFYSVRFAQDSIKDVQIPSDSASVVVAYPTSIGLFGTEKHRL